MKYSYQTNDTDFNRYDIFEVMCRAVDNLELLLSQPDESVDLIYCDILYGTGRNFGDYQDLKPIRSEIEEQREKYVKEVMSEYGVVVHWEKLEELKQILINEL